MQHSGPRHRSQPVSAHELRQLQFTPMVDLAASLPLPAFKEDNPHYRDPFFREFLTYRGNWKRIPFAHIFGHLVVKAFLPKKLQPSRLHSGSRAFV
jgi:hypothetical protein